MTLEVATIQREQIEGVQEHVGIIAAVSELLKHRQPGVVAGDRLAVQKVDRESVMGMSLWGPIADSCTATIRWCGPFRLRGKLIALK